MNPTLEVQITARLDKLDAGLKLAEARINQTSVTMGKAGEKAGANFGESFAANLPAMMIATAIAHTLGKGLLEGVKGINTGKSGEEIGVGLAQGIVDGAKSLPVVGVVFEMLDEMVNGADRYIEKLNEAVKKAVEKYISSMQAMTQATKDFKKATQEKVEDSADSGNPAAIAKRAMERQNKKADDDAQAMKELGRQALRDKRKSQDEQDAKNMASMQSEGVTGDVRRALAGNQSRDSEIAANKKKSDSEFKRAAEAVAKNEKEIDAAVIADKLANLDLYNKKVLENNAKSAAEQKTANDKAAAAAKSLQEINIKAAIDSGDYQGAQKQIDAQAAAEQKALDEKSRKTAMSTGDYQAALKEINNKAAAEQKALEEKSQKDAKEVGNQMVADFKEQKKEMYDAAMQAQEDIIKGEQAVQKKVDKAKVFSEAVSSAGQGFISSGQTALGQFNFAQQGAGSSAIDMAKKQVASLEKIEQATAEQVRLTRENKGFL